MNINFDVDGLVNIIYEAVVSLCQKFGVAIDWSRDNVAPYVMEVLSRYRTMEIISLSAAPAVVILCAIWIFYLYERSKKIEDYFWDCDLHFPGALLILLSIILLSAIVTAIINIGDLMRWIFVPEVEYANLIKELVSKAVTK